MHLRLIATYSAIAMVVLTAARAQEVKNCKVEFVTRASPVLVKIAGSAKTGCKGTLKHDGKAVLQSGFEVELESLDTGIRLRNRHLKENYLKTKDHPRAMLKILNVSNLSERLQSGSGESPFSAELMLQKKKRKIEGTYSVSGNSVTAKMEVELENFGIERPKFMGVKVVESVQVTVSFELPAGSPGS